MTCTYSHTPLSAVSTMGLPTRPCLPTSQSLRLLGCRSLIMVASALLLLGIRWPGSAHAAYLPRLVGRVPASRSTSRRLCLLPPQGAAVRSSWVLASLAAPSTGSFFFFSFLYSQLYQKRHLDQSMNAIMRRLTGYAVPPQDDRPASARLDEPLMACSQAKSSAQAKAFITCWQGPK